MPLGITKIDLFYRYKEIHMKIKEQVKLLAAFFRKENINFAVVGAFALSAYGYTRATKDIDFITGIENQEKIVKYLELLGFETLHVSDGFSNHLRKADYARVDFVYVDKDTAAEIYGSAKRKVVLNNIELPVVSPEHLIAMKLFAVKNDPGRIHKEFADIKELINLTNPDKSVIRGYFKKYGQEKYYNEITGW